MLFMWMKALSTSTQNDYSVSFPTTFPSRSNIYTVVSTLINPETAVGTETENNRGCAAKAAVISSYSTSNVVIRRIGSNAPVCLFIAGKS